MTQQDYYAECISESLSEMGLKNVLTVDQIQRIADDISIAVENKSLTFYSPESYDKTEIRNLKEKLKLTETTSENREKILKNYIAENNEMVDVGINTFGKVEVRRRK